MHYEYSEITPMDLRIQYKMATGKYPMHSEKGREIFKGYAPKSEYSRWLEEFSGRGEKYMRKSFLNEHPLSFAVEHRLPRNIEESRLDREWRWKEFHPFGEKYSAAYGFWLEEFIIEHHA